nr:hypothetical protein Iba_chr07cCG3890 [Ipomoea batatas]
MASVTPAPSVPGSQAATKPSTFSRSEGSKYIGLPEMRIANVGTLSATKLISLEPLKGMMRCHLSNYFSVFTKTLVTSSPSRIFTYLFPGIKMKKKEAEDILHMYRRLGTHCNTGSKGVRTAAGPDFKSSRNPNLPSQFIVSASHLIL